jgi:hypothetical protein
VADDEPHFGVSSRLNFGCQNSTAQAETSEGLESEFLLGFCDRPTWCWFISAFTSRGGYLREPVPRGLLSDSDCICDVLPRGASLTRISDGAFEVRGRLLDSASPLRAAEQRTHFRWWPSSTGHQPSVPERCRPARDVASHPSGVSASPLRQRSRSMDAWPDAAREGAQRRPSVGERRRARHVAMRHCQDVMASHRTQRPFEGLRDGLRPTKLLLPTCNSQAGPGGRLRPSGLCLKSSRQSLTKIWLHAPRMDSRRRVRSNDRWTEQLLCQKSHHVAARTTSHSWKRALPQGVGRLYPSNGNENRGRSRPAS